MHLVDRRTVSCSKRCLPSIDVKGCITPAPIPGQCSFHRENATLLCESWSRCKALNCNVFRTDCQARGRLDTVEHSFGDAYAYVYPGRHPSIGFERNAYHRRFDTDYFVADAMYVYNRFFAKSTRRGFFVESGALDGSVYGSNSYYFERYLGWNGLLVEASSRNFDRLRIRRGGSDRVHSVGEELLGMKHPSVKDVEGLIRTANANGKLRKLMQTPTKQYTAWMLQVDSARLFEEAFGLPRRTVEQKYDVPLSNETKGYLWIPLPLDVYRESPTDPWHVKAPDALHHRPLILRAGVLGPSNRIRIGRSSYS